MAEGYRYGALAGHRVQTQVALACQIVCVYVSVCVRALLWPLLTHTLPSAGLLLTAMCGEGEHGQKPAAREGACVRMCVSACKYPCVCFLRVYLCARGGGSGGGGHRGGGKQTA